MMQKLNKSEEKWKAEEKEKKKKSKRKMIKEQVWRINKISNDTIIHPNIIEMMYNNDLYSEEKSTTIIVTEDSNKINLM